MELLYGVLSEYKNYNLSPKNNIEDLKVVNYILEIIRRQTPNWTKSVCRDCILRKKEYRFRQMEVGVRQG
jgi:hypothetical protein